MKRRQRTHAASGGASEALPHEVGARPSRSEPKLNTHALYPSRSELRGITFKNKVKHEGVFDQANLDNVIQALAALFLLICKVKNSKKLMLYGYLGIDPSIKHAIISERIRENKHPILTNLFISSIRS